MLLRRGVVAVGGVCVAAMRSADIKKGKPDTSVHRRKSDKLVHFIMDCTPVNIVQF